MKIICFCFESSAISISKVVTPHFRESEMYNSIVYPNKEIGFHIATRNETAYLKQCISEFRMRLKEREHEISSLLDMNKYYHNQLKVVQEQCQQLTLEVERLKEQKSREIEKYRNSIQKLMSDFIREKAQLEEKNEDWQKILLEEIKIREAIQVLLLSREYKAKEEIKTLKKIIMIPRAHFKFLEKMKYDEILNSQK